MGTSVVGHGYDFAYFDGLNCFYVANEVSELKERLIVPPNVLDEFVRFPEWSSAQKTATLEQELVAQRGKSHELEAAFQGEQVQTAKLRSALQAEQTRVADLQSADAPDGYRAEPARAAAGGYVYARRFACQCIGSADECLTDDPLEAGRRRHFIGLDWCSDHVPLLKARFLEQRRRGTRIVFVASDFRSPTMETPLDAFTTIAYLADGVVCTSRAADEVHERLSKADLHRLQPLSLGFLEPTVDVLPSLSAVAQSEDSAWLILKVNGRQLLEAVLGNSLPFLARWSHTSSTETAVHCPESRASTTPQVH
jgi:hypothetical protein